MRWGQEFLIRVFASQCESLDCRYESIQRCHNERAVNRDRELLPFDECCIGVDRRVSLVTPPVGMAIEPPTG